MTNDEEHQLNQIAAIGVLCVLRRAALFGQSLKVPEKRVAQWPWGNRICTKDSSRSCHEKGTVARRRWLPSLWPRSPWLGGPRTLIGSSGGIERAISLRYCGAFGV